MCFNSRQEGRTLTQHEKEEIRMDKLEQLFITLLTHLGLYGKFGCIYADPPWSPNQKGKLGAINHYGLMKTLHIMMMPIKYLAAEDSMLFSGYRKGLYQRAYRLSKAGDSGM